MGRSALRSILILTTALSVAIAAGPVAWGNCPGCCAVTGGRGVVAVQQRANKQQPPSCCQHDGEVPPSLPAPNAPCGDCCRASEPQAKSEALRYEVDDSASRLVAALPIQAIVPDAGEQLAALDSASWIHASDPPLRVLLCVWRN